jgi:uncharacterized phage protein gp47/JayE
LSALADFVPLRTESVDSIRARIDTGVNAGLDPTDPRWTDTTPGGFFWDHTQVVALEAEMLWDFGSTELPASVFLPFSWGDYLDYWGELLDVPRKDEVAAIGVVTLENTGTTSQIVGPGTQVAAPTQDPEAEPLVYLTTVDAFTLLPGTSADVAVQAEEAGSQYNIAAGSVTMMLSGLDGVTVVNAASITGGADVEADDPYKARLLLEFSSTRGGGTQDDYVAEGLARPGVGGVVVEPRWAGPGTVRLVLTDPAGSPLSAPAVAVEQEFWDPPSAPGDGLGAAPIDAVTTVATVAELAVATELWLQLLEGYTVSGEPGKQDLSAAISTAVMNYVNSLKPGEDVLLHRVMQAALEVPGVYNVVQVTINTLLADLAVSALQVARAAVGAVTMTTAAP